MIKSCAFTGHRKIGEDFDDARLERAVRNLIDDGVKEFFCGMAQGFDMTSAECVISLKKEYNLKLTACIPCPSQPDCFSAANKIRYGRILEECDEKIIIAPSYYRGCMHERDRFMVDGADVILAYLNKNSGGTYYTVNYAKKQGKKIIYI